VLGLGEGPEAPPSDKVQVGVDAYAPFSDSIGGRREQLDDAGR
jgi:hypothetical protein